jgi:hypothetical protein
MPDTEDRIDFYHRLYGKILTKVSDHWPENNIDIAGRIFEQISKDLRSEMIAQMRKQGNEARKEKNTGYIPNDIDEKNLATKKQRQTIHKFGVKKIPDNLSREEASELLEEMIDLSRYGNKEILKEKVESLNQVWEEGTHTNR